MLNQESIPVTAARHSKHVETIEHVFEPQEPGWFAVASLNFNAKCFASTTGDDQSVIDADVRRQKHLSWTAALSFPPSDSQA
ncbi:hypothetical protein [Paraburkholderia ginsengiterrae]|uniref:hypothetical protein n=1 Tax=Paraburkholderia ginsengiterrae TaxID=1462993 RepID=UPI001042685D|nr:hypothetical protein [Paraburkholderia ginsengiterrae]